MRALILALALAACSSSPVELPPPQLPERAGFDPVVAARAEGVVFRGAGRAPDFVLSIFRDNRISLAWGAGAQQQHFPAAERILPRWNGEIYAAQSEAHSLRVEIRHLSCAIEGLADETYTARITVILDGERRDGCGQSL